MSERPPVRLVSHDDGSLTITVGRETATISRAAWSKLLAHPEDQRAAAARPKPAAVAAARPETSA